ncbi:MAG: hypothetical protein ABIC40_02770, partial [bacterium]
GLILMMYGTNIAPPQPPLIVALILIAPLPMGFGLTLVLEGQRAKDYFGKINYWPALLIANIASYIFLALVIPFSAPNPFPVDPYRFPGSFYGNVPFHADLGEKSHLFRWRMAEKLQKDASAEEIVRMFEDQHASTLQLLGLQKREPFPGDYNYKLEIDALTDGFSHSVGRDKLPDPSVGIKVIDLMLSNASMDEKARSRFENLRRVFEFWQDSEKAVKNKDQAMLDTSYEKWKDLYDGNSDVDIGRISPGSIFYSLLLHSKSDLVNPSDVESEEDEREKKPINQE